MSLLPTLSAATTADPTDRIADRLLGAVLDGPIEPETRRLLTTAADGDIRLLRALVLTGLGLGDLVRRDGYWQWNPATSRAGRLATLIETRAARFTGPQLAALRVITDSWTRPYTAVEQASGPVMGAETEAGSGTPAESGTAFGGPGTSAAAFRLTVRERQILALLADGLTAQAMAHRLRLSPRTVAKHQERMYRKFGTSDRLTTVLRAQRLGLLPPAPARVPLPAGRVGS